MSTFLLLSFFTTSFQRVVQVHMQSLYAAIWWKYASENFVMSANRTKISWYVMTRERLVHSQLNCCLQIVWRHWMDEWMIDWRSYFDCLSYMALNGTIILSNEFKKLWKEVQGKIAEFAWADWGKTWKNWQPISGLYLNIRLPEHKDGIGTLDVAGLVC